jgi:hypothetical protein
LAVVAEEEVNKLEMAVQAAEAVEQTYQVVQELLIKVIQELLDMQAQILALEVAEELQVLVVQVHKLMLVLEVQEVQVEILQLQVHQ